MSAPLSYDVFATHCPSRETLQLVTTRWGTLTLAALADQSEAARFGDLRRRIEGISDKMLSQTLKQLADGGMVKRTQISDSPVHVEYALTKQGREVATAVTRLVSAVYAVQPHLT